MFSISASREYMVKSTLCDKLSLIMYDRKKSTMVFVLPTHFQCGMIFTQTKQNLHVQILKGSELIWTVADLEYKISSNFWSGKFSAFSLFLFFLPGEADLSKSKRKKEWKWQHWYQTDVGHTEESNETKQWWAVQHVENSHREIVGHSN